MEATDQLHALAALPSKSIPCYPPHNIWGTPKLT